MINWSQFQHLGETNIALESAVGVLLYQMGVCAIFVLGVLVWLAWKLWALHVRSHDPLLAVGALGLLTILANGIFQEEALFAPLALGLIAGLAGLLLGRAYRAGINPPVAATQGPRAHALRPCADGGRFRAARRNPHIPRSHLVLWLVQESAMVQPVARPLKPRPNRFGEGPRS